MKKSSFRPAVNVRRGTTLQRLFAASLCAFAASALVSGPSELPTFSLTTALCQEPAETPQLPAYPDDDAPIDAAPVRFIGYELIKDFNFADPAVPIDGWTGCERVTLSKSDAGLVETIPDDFDPYFISCPLTDMPSGKILVRLRCSHTTDVAGKLYYAAKGEGYSEDRSQAFDLRNDDRFHDYDFLFDTKKPIESIRFDIGDNAGLVVVEYVKIYKVDAEPIRFGAVERSGNALAFDLINDREEGPQSAKLTFHGAAKGAPDAVRVVGRDRVSARFPGMKPFEELEVVMTPDATGKPVARRYFAYHKDAFAPAPGKAVPGEAPTMRRGDLAIRFAPDASGAEIYRSGALVGVVAPLFYEEGDGAAIVAKPRDYAAELAMTRDELDPPANKTRLVPTLERLADDGQSVEFAIREVDVDAARKALDDGAPVDAAGAPEVGSLRFSFDDDGLLAFDFDAPRPIHAPVLHVVGTMREAVFPGVEYLEEGEHSSSTADIETAEHIRYAPSAYWVTQPYAAIVADSVSALMLYDDPTTQAVFAVPDFLDGNADSSRMNVCGLNGSGKIRVAAPEPLEDAILFGTRAVGLPEPPTPAVTGRELDERLLAGLEESLLKRESGWLHAVLSEKVYSFEPTFGCDYVSTIWEISGKVPEIPQSGLSGNHLPNYASLFLTGEASMLRDHLAAQTRGLAEEMRADGSYRYSGKYLRGSRDDFGSGYSASRLYLLADAWRLTGNKEALAALLKGLEFANTLRVPRGAQVWELSIHTPDVMGSSRCCVSNVRAYEATGDAKYLEAARRWALRGVPFVYLWEDRSLPPFEERETPAAEPVDREPMMKYATIAVFGASNWRAPNWMGRPVQWCGLDYAYALMLLAPYDATLDWRKIAEGIVASAESQIMVDAPFAGLLPDSFQIDTQERFPFYINPCVVHMTRRLLDGEMTNLRVADVAGRRVAAPFPLDVEGNVLRITARKGVEYQIMIDGEELRTIESQGVDEIAF